MGMFNGVSFAWRRVKKLESLCKMITSYKGHMLQSNICLICDPAVGRGNVKHRGIIKKQERGSLGWSDVWKKSYVESSKHSVAWL